MLHFHENIRCWPDSAVAVSRAYARYLGYCGPIWTLPFPRQVTQQRPCPAFHVAKGSESQLYQNICLSSYDSISSAAGRRPLMAPLCFPSRMPATVLRFVCQPPGPSVIM